MYLLITLTLMNDKADRNMQELSHDATREYVALDLPDSIHCQHNALLESYSTQYWDPPPHVQMTSVVGHGHSPGYGTQSVVSAVDSGSDCASISASYQFCSLSIDPDRLVGLSQHLTQGLAHHVNFHNGEYSLQGIYDYFPQCSQTPCYMKLSSRLSCHIACGIDFAPQW